MPENVYEMSGNLSKMRGGFALFYSKWELRYFTLSTKGELCYHDRKERLIQLDEGSRGHMDLSKPFHFKLQTLMTHSPTEFTISISGETGETWYLCADVKENFERWVAALRSRMVMKVSEEVKDEWPAGAVNNPLIQNIVHKELIETVKDELPIDSIVSLPQPTTQCVICEYLKVKGIKCKSHHFVCEECFSSYVKILFVNQAKLVDSKYLIPCAAHNCHNPVAIKDSICNLNTEGIEAYVNALRHTCIESEKNKRFGIAVFVAFCSLSLTYGLRGLHNISSSHVEVNASHDSVWSSILWKMYCLYELAFWLLFIAGFAKSKDSKVMVQGISGVGISMILLYLTPLAEWRASLILLVSIGPVTYCVIGVIFLLSILETLALFFGGINPGAVRRPQPFWRWNWARRYV